MLIVMKSRGSHEYRKTGEKDVWLYALYCMNRCIQHREFVVMIETRCPLYMLEETIKQALYKWLKTETDSDCFEEDAFYWHTMYYRAFIQLMTLHLRSDSLAFLRAFNGF